MSLSGRFLTLMLTTLGLVLVGFSAAIYAAASVALNRQVDARLSGALDVLAAAAEVHPDEVEWEPQERVLPLGMGGEAEELRWLVFDHHGSLIDRSRNLPDAELQAGWTPRDVDSTWPSRLVDREGRSWRVARRRIAAGLPTTGSRAAGDQPAPLFIDQPLLARPSLVLTVGTPIGPTSATLTALLGFLAALGAGIWLVAALLCRRLSRRALEPLRRMAESARGLDAADPGWCLERAGTGDELDDLGRAFNDLLGRLHLAYDRQRRFGSDASHQLRTPLTVLIGQIEVALRRERTVEEYRRVLTSALGRSVQLGQIVEALLFLARAESDARPPEGEPIDLAGWAAGHLADRPGVTLHQPSAADRPSIRAHPHLLGQLLDNLLDNAAKYAPAGTPIVVEAARSGPVAMLAVEDCGPGIPPEDLDRVFEPFHRSAEARRSGTPGAGLGLAVVRRIASAFGATATARNVPGRGCRIEIRFPDAGRPA